MQLHIDRKVILLILVFSIFLGYFAHEFTAVYASVYATGTVSGSLAGVDLRMLGGAFAPLVGIGGSPLITLTMLSGAGTLLNEGIVNPEHIPLSGMLMALPISNLYVLIGLALVTGAKFALSLSSTTKLFSDATLGTIERVLGIVCSIGGVLVITFATTVYAAEIAATSSSAGIGRVVLTIIISFVSALIAYVIYVVVRTMVSAGDACATIVLFVFPGATAAVVVIKHITIALYSLLIIFFPAVAVFFGIIVVAIACLMFGRTKRMERYYKHIYLFPLLNRIFRKDYRVPLVPKKLPYGIAEEFDTVELCIECFFMNKKLKLYKRETCWFVRSNGINYIFKKRLFGKAIKIEVPTEAYIERPYIFGYWSKKIKPYLYLKIFTDEAQPTKQRLINAIIRREHGKSFEELCTIASLVDYNEILEERKRKKDELRAQKIGELIDSATGTFSSTKNKIKDAFT